MILFQILRLKNSNKVRFESQFKSQLNNPDQRVRFNMDIKHCETSSGTQFGTLKL